MDDLISRKALLEKAYYNCGAEYVVVDVEDVENAPEVDAEPAKHGRWLKLSPWNHNTQSCLCLNCDNIVYMIRCGVYIGKIPKYCPNCGSKMDGGANDGSI